MLSKINLTQKRIINQINNNKNQRDKNQKDNNQKNNKQEDKKEEENKKNLKKYDNTILTTNSFVEIKPNEYSYNNHEIFILENLEFILTSQTITKNKFVELIEILDGCLTHTNSIKVLNKLHTLYQNILSHNVYIDSIQPIILNSLYMFLLKLNNKREEISIKEFNFIENNILISIDYSIKNVDTKLLQKYIALFNKYLLFSQKNTISKYISIYLKIKIIIQKNNLNLHNDLKEFINFKETITSKILSAKNLQNFLSLIN